MPLVVLIIRTICSVRAILEVNLDLKVAVMFELQRKDVPSEQILYLYDRLHFRGKKVYVPDVVAYRYGLNGRKLSCKEVKELLLRDWDKAPRLFKRYALNDCKCLAFIFLFP